MLSLSVRRVGAHERDFVLATWKNELAVGSWKWRRGLEPRDFWCLVNHVIDRITFPSSLVFVGCHENAPDVPVCWAAVRKLAGLSSYELVYLYLRREVYADPGLANALQEALLSSISKDHPLTGERRPFNPFLELRR